MDENHEPNNTPSSPRPEAAHETQTAVAVRPKRSPPEPKQLPPFKVLLHNDDVNGDLFVVATIVELTPLNKDRATEAMLEADKTGVSLLLVTHKERAELYVDQFTSKGLTVTMEPTEA